MQTPQLLTDMANVMMLLAPSAALLCLVLAGNQPAARRWGELRNRRRIHQVDVLGGDIRNSARTAHLVQQLRCACAFARRRHQHLMAFEL